MEYWSMMSFIFLLVVISDISKMKKKLNKIEKMLEEYKEVK